MAGAVENAGRWAEADVYMGDVGVTAPTDTSTAWAAGWTAVGLLNPGDPIVETLSEDTTTLKAWGNISVEVVNSNVEAGFSFTAIEDNATVFSIRYEGSDAPVVATGTETRTAKAPQRVSHAWGIELRNGDKVKRIIIPKGKVSAVGDVSYNETDMTTYPVTVTIESASDGILKTEVMTAST